MTITNINTQIMLLSFAKKQSEIPVVPLKYKIILAKTTTGLFTDMYINNYAMQSKAEKYVETKLNLKKCYQ